MSSGTAIESAIGAGAEPSEQPVSDSVLEVRNVSKVFATRRGKTQALEDVSLTVRRGEFVSLVGPSGCGKTTLLRIIAGLTNQTAGEVLLNGVSTTTARGRLGFVFQDISLLPWRSVLGNVQIGLEGERLTKSARRERALETLELVGLQSVASARPYHLSGGMQQRVGVARALAIQPDVLLMDEPFGQLDNFTRERLQVETAKLIARLHATVVFVTHDVDEAIFLSDRILLFKTKPGRLTRDLRVDLPPERWDMNVRADPAAIQLREVIAEELKEETDDRAVQY